MQTWLASITRAFVLSGLGSDQPIAQTLQGELPEKRFRNIYVGGKLRRHDEFKKVPEILSEVRRQLDSEVSDRIREGVAKEISARVTARERDLLKTVPSAAQRAEESAWARALFGLPAAAAH